jgi:copper chaperone CopZ
MNSNVLNCANTVSTAPGSLSILKLEAVNCLLVVDSSRIPFAHSASLAKKNVQFQSQSVGLKEIAKATLHTLRKMSGI